ncbi:MAG: CehA/McbA family metallohydrolase [Oscillibacter sp.]|nr:CehA/McbA family metallohydrolase [Oscillibacter sp.]
MELRLDLHIHSHHSPDGVLTLSEIASRAREAGLHGVAVCDHDRVLPEAERAAAFPGLLLIPGVEVSTDAGHLLGWFVTEPVRARTLPEAVAEIHAQGGIAVLAHPFEHTKRPERAEQALPYVDGIEVWNSRADRKNRQANAMARAFAAAHAVRGFAGSDAHTRHEIGNGVTVARADAPTPEAVRAALLSGDVRTEGRRSKAVWTAVSQYARRRKRGAGPLSYVKWAAFAVKCVLEDLFRP